MFCPNCGRYQPDQAKFCSECGFGLRQSGGGHWGPAAGTPPYPSYTKTPTQVLAGRERASAIVWTVVASLQGLWGLLALGALGWLGSLLGLNLAWGSLFQLGIAAWNAYGAYCSFRRVRRVLARQPGIVAEYDHMMAGSIVFIVLNVLFGGVIGVAGAVFDLVNRSYALANAPYLEDWSG